MTRHRWISGRPALGWGTALWLLFACASVAAGQGPVAGEERVEHLRPLDVRSEAILRGGLGRSATLRRLAAALEDSDLVVYVQVAQLRIPSRLSFMTATPGRRLALITLGFQNLEPSMTGWLGHELQHAVEVAAAPDVRSREDLDRLYRRIGEESSSGGWCTRAAQQARSAVLDELLANSRASRNRAALRQRHPAVAAFDAVLKHGDDARRFLAGDIQAELAPRGVDAFVPVA